MVSPNKDTIYIDIDEEITGIIDKVRASDGKIVALVLPKRASVLQSIVNMKLLKRSADNAKKRLVLITSESGLLPLAGAVGLYVAKTAQSKPEIPMAPVVLDDSEETIDEVDPDEFSPSAAADRPIGELAGLTAQVVSEDGVETLELDNDEEASDVATPAIAAPVAAAKPTKIKKNKKLAVPNFERFRLFLVLGAAVIVLLIIGVVFAAKILPKAVIGVTTNASNVNVGVNLALSTTATALDSTTNTIPAKQVSEQKTTSQQVATTGQKNNGSKATGYVVFYNCNKDDLTYGQDENIPAGTGVSNNGNTYITQQTINVPPSNFNKDGSCRKNAASSQIMVIAQAGGSGYNINDGAALSVAFTNPSDGSKSFSAASAGAIAGGTDNIVKIVTAADVSAANQKLTAQDASGVKQDLQTQLQQANMYAIINTYNTGTPTTSNSAEIGTAADTVTVTQVTTYTMFGVKESDLKTLVDAGIKKQIDTSKQSILNEGIDTAKFTVASTAEGAAQVVMQTTATAGPDISADQIKQQVAGKKGGAVKSLLQTNPGVTDVQVKLSPFWVTTVPSNTAKITVTIAKPTAATN